MNWLPGRVRNWIRHIPIIAGGQRWLVKRFLSNEPFAHTINAGPARGLRFEVILPQDKAVWAGTYEMDFALAISQGVEKGSVCFDVGGYRGYMSGVMAMNGAAQVFVFEPFPANLKALERLVSLNPACSIQVKPFAVGKIEGSATFRVMPDQSMGKLSTSEFQSGASALQELQVPIHTLDSLVETKGIPPPNLIKIDVEGAEIDVLLGAIQVLHRYRPRLFIEAHSETLAARCRAHLQEIGYFVRQLEPGQLSPEVTSHLIAEPQ